MRRAVVAALLALGCHPQPGPEPPISPRAPKAAPATETLRDAEPTPREGLRLILDLANDLRVDQVQNAALVALPPSVGTHNAPLLLAPGGARVAHELVAAESVEGFVGGHFPTALVAVVSNREDYAVARFERGHWIPLQAESDPYAPSRERPDGYAPATSKLSNCPARLAHLHEVLQLSDGSRVEIGDDCESDLYQEILGGAKDYDAPFKQVLSYWPAKNAPARVYSVPVYEVTQVLVSPSSATSFYMVAESWRGEGRRHQDVVHLDVTTGHWEELRFPEDLRDFCLTDDGNVWAQDEASVFHANPEPGTVSDDSGFWQVPVREGAWRFQVVDIPRYTLQGTALPPFPNRLSCIGNHIALEANLTDDHHLLFWTGPTAFTAPLRSR